MTTRGMMVLACAWVGALLLSSDVQAAGPNDLRYFRGTCTSNSHIAEGPLGSDLTKRQSRFFCDSVSIAFFGDYKGHAIIQFAQSKANHAQILGFAGRFESDGLTMFPDRVYLAEGKPTTVSDGVCKLLFTNRILTGMVCGVVVDETGRRTSVVAAFDIAPGQ